MRRPVAAALTVIALAAGATAPASAQANLDAGKSPAQMFAQGCGACHHTPQEVAYASRDFLMQHYTTGPQQADAMAAYLQAVRHEPLRAKPRRSPSAEADIAEVTATGSIGAELTTEKPAEPAAEKPAETAAEIPVETLPAPVLPQIEE